MKQFEGIHFKGDFRTYQQRVLGNIDKYLSDGKVNIVAAPGSGKTILGLELMRKLGEPCLILSPTKDSRDRWGNCLKEHFLEDESRFEEFYSADLHNPKLINSITYEALYMAMEQTKEKADEETTYFDMDLLKVLYKQGVKTICLEEPHHLGNHKQKALEKFLECMGEKVMRICLTSILPYDLETPEWNRYYRICGEIDEEIFVPELVAQGFISPHQDYVYFSYPTVREMQVIQEHQEFVRKILVHPHIHECLRKTRDAVITQDEYRLKQSEQILKQFPQEKEALLVLLQYCGMVPKDMNLLRRYEINELPKPEDIYFQRALQFLVDEGTRFCAAKYVNGLRKVLQENRLYWDKKVNLCLPEEKRKAFTFSVSKLKSIEEITCHEYRNLGKALRMVILTDYNRGSKENLSKIGTDESYDEISAVSIFETLRRQDDTMNIAVLSGSFIILPGELVEQGTMVSLEPLDGTRYAKVEVYGTPGEGMNLISELFREGKLQVLIGTNALWEEGWDEPGMNTLILVNSVEPFMASNRMRSLVIKSDPQNPDKTANIWHLVTLEPEELLGETISKKQPVDEAEGAEILSGYDYDIVKRRLAAFMTPHVETGDIQSGMGRLTLMQSPFDEKSVLAMNKEMLKLSGDRNKMSKVWKKQLMETPFRVIAETACSTLPCASAFRYMKKIVIKKIKDFLVRKLTGLLIFLLTVLGIIFFFEKALGIAIILFVGLISVGVLPYIVLFDEFKREVRLMFRHLGLWKQLGHDGALGVLEILAQNIEKTLTECGIITPGSLVVVEKVGKSNRMVRVHLQNATRHDQSVFNKAIRELMTPIEKPQYLLVPKVGRFVDRYQNSLACPSIIGQKEKYVKILKKYMAENLHFIELLDTTEQEGRTLLNQCRKYFASGRLGKAYEKEAVPGEETKYIVVKESNPGFIEDKKL